MTTANHVDCRALPASGYVDGVYGLVNPQVGTTRAGKPYLKCLLRDATGEVPARQWTFKEEDLAVISSTGFVWIAGHTQVYNGQVQIILEDIRAMDVSDAELALLLPSTDKDVEAMFEDVRSLLATLKHPAMRALAGVYLADEELMANFRRAPAARNLHHAWIGGLLEHTLQVMKLADRMLPLYPQLNRDIVLLGLFLHDMGKVAELTWDKGFDYTVDGNLVGHIVRGAVWLQFKAALAAKQSGHRLPGEALRVLQHIILSHHHQPEFGAAKRPSTPEAMFVAILDNLDAKTQMAISATHDSRVAAAAGDRAAAATGDGRADAPCPDGMSAFTDKIWALDARLYWPDPLADGGMAEPITVETRPNGHAAG